MPLKLRTPKSRPHRITEAAVEAFRAGDELALHRALGLRPWMPSPLEVVGGRGVAVAGRQRRGAVLVAGG